MFHVSLLKAYKSRDGFHIQPPTVPSLLDDYVIDKIIDHDVLQRGRKRIIRYKVRYLNLTEDSDTWEAESSLIPHVRFGHCLQD